MKKIITLILTVAIIVVAFGAITSITGKKTERVSPLKFSRGAIDDNGVHYSSNLSIYTEDLILCQGLVIEPDFESHGKYRVFYYGEDQKFIGSTEEMNTYDGVYRKDNTFLLAKYCRIMITPDLAMDSNGNVDKDVKIAFYEVYGIANKYKISVNKDQTLDYEEIIKDLDDVCEVLGMGTYHTETSTFVSGESPYYFFDEIDVSHSSQLVLKVKESTLEAIGEYGPNRHPYPCIYDCSTNTPIFSYTRLFNTEEFVYVCFDVSDYTSVIGFVDSESIDVLEIYVL